MSKPPSPRSLAAKAEVLAALDGDPDPAKLQAALTALARWRAELMHNTVTTQDGAIVQAGPFAGMHYVTGGAKAPHVPRLLGCHDAALHPVLEAILAEAPPLVMDIGCGNGFFATGFAMRLPRSTIWARDKDETARTATKALAEANKVAGRVKIGGALTHADFDICRAQHTLIRCDIGAATTALLDPDRAKGLRRADLLVSFCALAHPTLGDTLAERFADTHLPQVIMPAQAGARLPAWMSSLSDLDQLIAQCEWHDGPTPYVWLTRKNRD